MQTNSSIAFTFKDDRGGGGRLLSLHQMRNLVNNAGPGFWMMAALQAPDLADAPQA